MQILSIRYRRILKISGATEATLKENTTTRLVFEKRAILFNRRIVSKLELTDRMGQELELMICYDKEKSYRGMI